MVQVSEGSVVFLFRIGMAIQSRQKVLFRFPSNSVLSRVCSTSPLVKAHWRCCWGKPASPLMYQSSGCTSLWFWPHFRPRSEQGLHPITFGSVRGEGGWCQWRLWTLIEHFLGLGFVRRFVNSSFTVCKWRQHWAWRPWLVQSFGSSCCAGVASSQRLYCSGKPLPKHATVGAGSLFQCFLGQEFLACQREQILGNPCFDLSCCWVCFVCLLFS